MAGSFFSMELHLLLTVPLSVIIRLLFTDKRFKFLMGKYDDGSETQKKKCEKIFWLSGIFIFILIAVAIVFST